jgi:hypothetical protein
MGRIREVLGSGEKAVGKDVRFARLWQQHIQGHIILFLPKVGRIIIIVVVSLEDSGGAL